MAIACFSTRQLAVILAIVCTVTLFKQVDAKRGCSSFGHSCFGGHGKRSEGALEGAPPSLRALGALGGQDGQEEVAVPRPVYPPTIRDILSAGDDIIPVRNGGFSDNSEEQQGSVDQMKYHFSPYLRHWLIAFRKAQQQLNGEGYPLNMF